MTWDCGLKYLFSLPPALQQGGVCALRSPDEFSRLEMVQRLAKDGCRFLQNQNYRLPERPAQDHDFIEAGTVESRGSRRFVFEPILQEFA
ncbi:rap guanine nucleotide exchange factor 5 [Tachysurus ichikawai]